VASAAERRRLRRERRAAAAAMLARGKTQVATAAALGVTDRTIRNWAKAKSFQSALERARERAAREAAKERSRRERNARRRFRRQHPGLWADLQARRPELRSPFD
jgi:transposase